MSGTIESSIAGESPRPSNVRAVDTESGWAGWIVFAGWMLILLGFFHLLHGFVALFHDEVFPVGRTDLALITNYTVWGWIHLVAGAVAIVAGIAVQRGRLWARTVAVLVAFASALINMTFLPAFPIWSAIMVAVDIVIIWAITVHGSVMKEPQLPG